MVTKNEASTDVDIARIPNLDQLKNLSSFDDAAQLAKELNADVKSAAELGDGFSLLENKDELIGKPCLFVMWTFSPGDFGKSFVSARVLVQVAPGSYAKYVVNDGSTGIRDQLEALTTADSGASMLYAQKGLRKSEYNYTDEKGESKPAKTYYIDTSGTGTLTS